MFERLINKFSSINSIKINKKSNKKILLVDRGRFYQAYLSLTLAKSLNDKFNYEPIVLLDANIGKKLKYFYKSYGIEKFDYIKFYKKFYFFLPTIFLFIKTIFQIKKKGIHWFIDNFSVKQILVGPSIWDYYIRHDLSFLKRNLNFKLSKVIFITILKVLYLDNYLNKNSFKSIIVNSNSYVSNSSLLLKIALQKKINVYYQTISDLHKLVKKNQVNANTLDIKTSKIKNLYKKKAEISKINLYLKKRFEGKFYNDNILDNKQLVSAYRKKTINTIKNFNYFLKKKKININSYKNIFLFAPHCFSDSNHAFGKFIFSDFFDQFYKTIEFIKKDSDNFWIVKSHPHSKKYGEEIFFKNYLNKIKKKNLLFIGNESNISTKCLLEFSDLVITTGGTIGLESACVGKKSLTTNKTYYSEYGLTYNPNNQKEYFENIINFKKEKLKKNSIYLAKKLLYWSTVGRGFDVYSPKNDKVKNNPEKLLFDFIKNKENFNTINLNYIKNIKKYL